MTIYLDDQRFGELIADCRRRVEQAMRAAIWERTGLTMLDPCPRADEALRETVMAILARNDIWPDYSRELTVDHAPEQRRA